MADKLLGDRGQHRVTARRTVPQRSRTSALLAEWIKTPYDTWSSFAQVSITKPSFSSSERKKKILYPKIFAAVEDPAIYGQEPVRLIC